MRSTSILLLAFLLAMFAGKANAIDYTFHFETDTGDEIAVDVSGTYDSPKYVFRNDKGYTAIDLFYQYVKSTLEKRNYIYLWQEQCDECATDISYEGKAKITKLGDVKVKTLQDLKKVSSNRSRTRTPDTNSNSPTNKFVESAASELGTRVVGAVFDLMTSSNKTDSNGKVVSPFIILTSRYSKPIAICRIKESGCQVIEEVVFSELDNGFSMSYPPGVVGDEDSIEVAEALDDFTETIDVSCRTVFTGSPGRLVAQTVCYIQN